jgi:hypothetical protein
MRTALSLALGVLLLLTASRADAGYYRARARGGVYVQPSYGATVAVYPYGLYGGFSLLAMYPIKQSGGPEQLENGVGFGLWGGWHATERLSLELGWKETYHNPVEVNSWWGGREVDYLVLDGFTLDARVHLGAGRGFDRVDPYVQGGLGLYALASENFGLDSVGTGFQLGGGLDFYLSPWFTIGARLLYHGISMGPPEGGQDDLFISAAALEGNLALHF